MPNLETRRAPPSQQSAMFSAKRLSGACDCRHRADDTCCEYTRSLELICRAEPVRRRRPGGKVPRQRGPTDNEPWRLFGPDGKLAYPPREAVRLHEEEARRKAEEKEKRLGEEPGNVIRLRDLRGRYDEEQMRPERAQRPTKRGREKSAEDERSFEEEVGGVKLRGVE